MRQISPLWQRETPKAGGPCHPVAPEAVETPGATLSRVGDTPRTGVPDPNSPAEPTKGSSQSTPPWGAYFPRYPLGRQGRFAPQPGSDGRLAGVAAAAMADGPAGTLLPSRRGRSEEHTSEIQSL